MGRVKVFQRYITRAKDNSLYQFGLGEPPGQRQDDRWSSLNPLTNPTVVHSLTHVVRHLC